MDNSLINALEDGPRSGTVDPETYMVLSSDGIYCEVGHHLSSGWVSVRNSDSVSIREEYRPGGYFDPPIGNTI